MSYNYAVLNQDNICVGLVGGTMEILDPIYIEIDNTSNMTSYLGKKYVNGNWEEKITTPAINMEELNSRISDLELSLADLFTGGVI
ncbi:hypothetical protein ACFQ3W_11375 [Paenibacillus puldeungensis]|uniref:Uncharacterized protein n=1 Tax=Paenibacillus puldeungensis TaxID=696536 RepID=A0ABW3RX67_9BACL